MIDFCDCPPEKSESWPVQFGAKEIGSGLGKIAIRDYRYHG